MGIIKERMDVMSSIGKASKQLSKMARGKTPLDPAVVRKLGDQMSAHAKKIPALFPNTKESRTGKRPKHARLSGNVGRSSKASQRHWHAKAPRCQRSPNGAPAPLAPSYAKSAAPARNTTRRSE